MLSLKCKVLFLSLVLLEPSHVSILQTEMFESMSENKEVYLLVIDCIVFCEIQWSCLLSVLCHGVRYGCLENPRW